MICSQNGNTDWFHPYSLKQKLIKFYFISVELTTYSAIKSNCCWQHNSCYFKCNIWRGEKTMRIKNNCVMYFPSPGAKTVTGNRIIWKLWLQHQSMFCWFCSKYTQSEKIRANDIKEKITTTKHIDGLAQDYCISSALAHRYCSLPQSHRYKPQTYL